MSIIGALRNAGIPTRDERVAPRQGAFTPVGIMLHHTASGGVSDLPALGICKHGRSDLPGPLCNILIGRHGTVVAISEGIANHAGRGDRSQLVRATKGEPPGLGPGPDQVNGNPWFIGIEIENNGVGEPWPPVVLDAVAAVCSALCAAYRWSPNSVIAHREWTRRKIDPTFDMNAMRSRIGTPQEDDFMAALSDQEQRFVFDTLSKLNALFEPGESRADGLVTMLRKFQDLPRKIDVWQTREILADLVINSDRSKWKPQTRKWVEKNGL